MIEELPSRRLVYRFNHELVRKALYDRLGSARRAELHLRVGEALESAGERSGRVLADLAHHFAAAAPLGATGRAVEYNLAAARAARSALAFDEAAARFRTALELRIEPASARAEAYLELGTASHRAGKVPDVTRRVPLGRGDRARARERRPARTSRDRLRGDVLAPRHRRRRCGRASRGGRGRAQRRELRVARRVAQRARPRARLPGRSRSWRAGADERDRNGAAARRSHRPRHRAHALLLVARERARWTRSSRW